jgi:hypothetical protein
MNEIEFTQLLEIALRRPLTTEEQARLQALLAGDPVLKEVWDEELALSGLITGLPDAPLASNFTRQVLDSIGRERPARSRASGPWRWLGLRRPAQQVMALGAVLVLTVLGYFQYQSFERHKMALALAQVGPNIVIPSEAVALAPDEIWRNFDAINRLGHVQSQPDEELLSVLAEFAMK